MVIRLTDACYQAVWPIKVWGTVAHYDPLNPGGPPVASRDFEIKLQPQHYLDVIDDIREFRGHAGDLQSVVTIRVAHFTDPGEVRIVLAPASGQIFNSFPLGAVDVIAPPTPCYLTLTWQQTLTGSI